ncbi:MAG: Fe(2+) transporter permease subunit FeoB [Thiotrichales bacterium]
MTDVTLAVIGNPNSGKTTLFNDLTGSHQRTGNWPGVTVERKEGRFKFHGSTYNLIDLPGTYSLDSESPSLDERVAREFILSRKADVIINIIDAANLERSLYLTAQLIEMRVPMLVVLNMMDVAAAQGYEIDIKALERLLGCPVVTSVATRKTGIVELEAAIEQLTRQFRLPTAQVDYGEEINQALEELSGRINHSVSPANQRWLALQLLLGHPLPHKPEDPALLTRAAELKAQLEDQLGEALDLLVADGRYGFAHQIAEQVVSQKTIKPLKLSDRIDAVVLNEWFGVPVFLLVMYLTFTLTINIGGAFIDFFDLAVGAVLIDELGSALSAMGAPDWLRVLLADGAGGGIQVVATFIPIIGFLYLCMSFLEGSGYMARAAFVMDRFMRRLGLPGKSFVPLIVGFGCNVPGIMAARTLEVERERIMTVMMVPFMSCGARLSVYALFAVVFFSTGGQNIVFLLYLLGILAAVFTAFLLKITILKGEPEPFLMELPTYQLPPIGSLLIHTWLRLRSFVMDAGKFIVIVVIVINVLNSLGTDGSFGNEDSERSALSAVGKSLTPVLSPFGIEEDNWPATVGIFTGVLAKEVVVGTLDAIYSQLDQPTASEEQTQFSLWPALTEAVMTIPANLADSVGALLDPLGLGVLKSADDKNEAAAEQDVKEATFTAMEHRFDGKIGAFAYLLFILLYFPCVAATAAIKRELGWGWTVFAMTWTTGLAYLAATVFYQLARFSAHPAQSMFWVGMAAVSLALVYWVLRRKGQALKRREADHKPFPIPVRVERKH